MISITVQGDLHLKLGNSARVLQLLESISMDLTQAKAQIEAVTQQNVEIKEQNTVLVTLTTKISGETAALLQKIEDLTNLPTNPDLPDDFVAALAALSEAATSAKATQAEVSTALAGVDSQVPDTAP